jgi:uncharacterized protein
MVKEKYTKSEIKEIIKKLIDSLSANNIVVDKIILYGSYAKGTPREHSDIDIAVISPSFKRRRIIDIQSDLAKASAKYLSVVEPVGYSSDDYKSAKMETLLGEIKKSGKILYSRTK